MLSEGHTDAHSYPLGRLYDEASLITERRMSAAELNAVLVQGALGAVHTKKGPRAFKRILEQLQFSTSIKPDVFDSHGEVEEED